MTYRVEACVVSNETLYQQDGGEPLATAIFWNEHLVEVFLSEADAVARAGELNAQPLLTLPPITADMMAADYLAEVRANGEWAIGNVARCTDDSDWEIVYEVLETAERCRPSAMRYYSDDGDLADVAWDMAIVAAKTAVRACQVEYPNACLYKGGMP